MSPKRSIRIEIGYDPVIFTNNIFFTNYSLLTSFSISSKPYTKQFTPHISLYFTCFLSFNNQMTKLKYCYSHLKSFVAFMFWVVLFMFLNHLIIPHTPNPLFHPISFFSSLMQSPNLFQILHCFIHHTARQFRSFFHFPSFPFSFHTPYQSVFRMLCNTIYASFSTKKCTLQHILFQLK